MVERVLDSKKRTYAHISFMCEVLIVFCGSTRRESIERERSFRLIPLSSRTMRKERPRVARQQDRTYKTRLSQMFVKRIF